MVEGREREREQTALTTEDPKLAYDYEGRFVKKRLEQERMAILPRVVKPSMFGSGGFALGGLRTFDRYTVAPISSLTGHFVVLGPGERTSLTRMLPSQVAFVMGGSGVSQQDGEHYEFGPEDVVMVPPYTDHRWIADSAEGLSVWMPQVRLWHVMGLLWHEFEEIREIPEGCRPLHASDGQLDGFEVPAGVLGLERTLRIRKGADRKRRDFFRARRSTLEAPTEETGYDWFLRRLAEESQLERDAPRVIRAAECEWEDTRQGRLRYYLHPWKESIAPQLDLVVQEIEPGGFSGLHRHLPEEVSLVLQGQGYDLHDDVRYDWEAGDLICVPTMAAHQQFNTGTEPVRLVSVWSRARTFQFLGGFEHLADASTAGGSANGDPGQADQDR